MTSTEQGDELATQRNEARDGVVTAPLTGSGDGLSILGVSFGYGAQAVLHDVNVGVPRGQVLAIMGPSGCGKTTLGRLVAGFLVPASGTIEVHGRPMAGQGNFVPAHRRQVGMVPQEGALFPHLNVADNVGFGLARRSPDRLRRIDECLALVGLDGFGGRRVHELSGGQQQRVAVARALAPRPDLVIMDEPFSALDANLRTTTRTLVFDAIADQGTTVMLITHDAEEALSCADHLALMSAGRVDQTGTPDEIYLHPLNREAAAASGPIVELSAIAEGPHAVTSLGRVSLRVSASGRGVVIVRPEQIEMRSSAPTAGQGSGGTVALATVLSVRRTGAHRWARCQLLADRPGPADSSGMSSSRAHAAPGGRAPMTILVPADLHPVVGDLVALSVAGSAVFEPETTEG